MPFLMDNDMRSDGLCEYCSFCRPLIGWQRNSHASLLDTGLEAGRIALVDGWDLELALPSD
jgi:hypothetical protein